MSKSIVTRYEKYSAFSGAPAECEHHLIFGKGVHKLADVDGLTIGLLHKEHNFSPKGTIYQIHDNPAAEKLSKMCGQLAWEKQYLVDKYQLPFEDLSQEARDAFMKRYKISYL